MINIVNFLFNYLYTNEYYKLFILNKSFSVIYYTYTPLFKKSNSTLYPSLRSNIYLKESNVYFLKQKLHQELLEYNKCFSDVRYPINGTLNMKKCIDCRMDDSVFCLYCYLNVNQYLYL